MHSQKCHQKWHCGGLFFHPFSFVSDKMEEIQWIYTFCGWGGWERFSEYTPSVGEEGGRDSVNTHLLWVRRVGEIQWIHTCCVWGGGRDSVNTHLLWTGAGRAPCKAVLAVSALPNKLWHALKITHTHKKNNTWHHFILQPSHTCLHKWNQNLNLKKLKKLWNRVEESDLQDCLTYKDQRRAAQPSDKSCDRSDRPCASLFRSGLWIRSSQPACPQSIHPWGKDTWITCYVWQHTFNFQTMLEWRWKKDKWRNACVHTHTTPPPPPTPTPQTPTHTLTVSIAHILTHTYKNTDPDFWTEEVHPPPTNTHIQTPAHTLTHSHGITHTLAHNIHKSTDPNSWTE